MDYTEKELERAILDCLAETHPRIDENIWMEFAQTPADELYNYHFGLGLYLRNNVLLPESKLYKLFIRAGIGHKDDMSSRMMERWHQELNKK